MTPSWCWKTSIAASKKVNRRWSLPFLGTRQVGFAVIATTLVLLAVFVPVTFMPGDTGRMFSEFSVALAIAVGFSGFVALTLSPMLASKILRGRHGDSLVATLARCNLSLRAAQSIAQVLAACLRLPGQRGARGRSVLTRAMLVVAASHPGRIHATRGSRLVLRHCHLPARAPRIRPRCRRSTT